MVALAGVNLISTDGQSPTAGLGDTFESKGTTWMYCVASEAIAKYAAVYVSFLTFEMAAVDSGVSDPTQLGAVQFAFADGDYGWVPVGPWAYGPDGVTPIFVLAADGTSEGDLLGLGANAGVLESGGVGQAQSLVATSSNSSGVDAAVSCIAEIRQTINGA